MVYPRAKSDYTGEILSRLTARKGLLERLEKAIAGRVDMTIHGEYQGEKMSERHRKALRELAEAFLREGISEIDDDLASLGVLMAPPPARKLDEKGIPAGVYWDLENQLFRDFNSGEQMPHDFYHAWIRRVSDFPVGRAEDDPESEKPGEADCVIPESEKPGEAECCIPAGVYFHGGHFYDIETNTRKGHAFCENWIDRAYEFPERQPKGE